MNLPRTNSPVYLDGFDPSGMPSTPKTAVVRPCGVFVRLSPISGSSENNARKQTGAGPECHRSRCRLVRQGNLETGRGEDWRGIPKVRPICFSPFPLGVPQ